MPKQNPTWQIDDVIDFEFFMADDNEQKRSDEEKMERDSKIFINGILPKLSDDNLRDSRTKIRLWVQEMRIAWLNSGKELPGQYFGEAYSLLLSICAVSGLVVGWTLAQSHLYFSGDKPINALVFLSVTVVPQVLLLLSVSVALLSNKFKSTRYSSKSILLLGWILRGILFWFNEAKEKGSSRASGQSRLKFAASWGTIKTKKEVYGALWYWPLLVLSQTFAVCFNIGIIAMLVFFPKIYHFYGVATWGISARMMSLIVDAVATPWLWLDKVLPVVSDNATPDDSWAEFLMLTVFFYGLLPRITLLVMVVLEEKRMLKRLGFKWSECLNLVVRMVPLVKADSPGPELTLVNPKDSHTTPTTGNDGVLIISSELQETEIDLQRIFAARGWGSWQQISAEVDFSDGNDELYAELQRSELHGEDKRIVVALNESQPPIRAIYLFLNRLRGICGRETMISVVLLGGGNPCGENFDIWKQKTAAEGDPYLQVQEVCHE